MNIQKTSGFSAVNILSSTQTQTAETQAGFVSAAQSANASTVQANQNTQATHAEAVTASTTAAPDPDPTPQELLEKAKSGIPLTDAEKMILVGDVGCAYEYAVEIQGHYDPKTAWGLKALNALTSEAGWAYVYAFDILKAPYDPKTKWGLTALNAIASDAEHARLYAFDTLKPLMTQKRNGD